MKKETITRYRDDATGKFTKPADDFDEESQATAEFLCQPMTREAKIVLGCIALAAILIAGLLAFRPHPDLATELNLAHGLTEANSPAITSPAMFADPQLALDRPEAPASFVVIIGPFTVKGWRDSEPVLFESR